MTEKDPKRPDRRSAIKGLASVALSSPITVPLSAVSAAPALTVPIFLKESIFSTDKAELDRKLSNENPRVYVRSMTTNFINIGVGHDKDILDKQLQTTLLGRAIQEADLVLLENPAGIYFSKIKDYSKGLGKEVIDIDRGTGAISQALRMSASLWAAFRALKQLGKDFVGLGYDAEKKKQLRREYLDYVLKTLGISELGLFPPTLLASMAANRWDDIDNKSGNYDLKYDVSATGDGRTVFMAMDVLKVIKDNAGKKVVVITGDAHAVGINYYLYEAEGQREFKSVIYNVIYGWLKYLPV